ncbi:hypothetical protein GCM10009838_08810 [Catenulispora subtropica]|uniref:Uncharacterized protein n=1 Tax=Catenulispora subtropica TaxID=450798 RepID=A0ABN2QQ74_9ACTN
MFRSMEPVLRILLSPDPAPPTGWLVTRSRILPSPTPMEPVQHRSGPAPGAPSRSSPESPCPPDPPESPGLVDARGRQIMISSSLRAVFGTMNARAQVSTRTPAPSQ